MRKLLTTKQVRADTDYRHFVTFWFGVCHSPSSYNHQKRKRDIVSSLSGRLTVYMHRQCHTCKWYEITHAILANTHLDKTFTHDRQHDCEVLIVIKTLMSCKVKEFLQHTLIRSDCKGFSRNQSSFTPCHVRTISKILQMDRFIWSSKRLQHNLLHALQSGCWFRTCVRINGDHTTSNLR